MALRLAGLALCALSASAVELAQDGASRPVSRVVSMLQGMLKDLEDEETKDEGATNLRACECKAKQEAMAQKQAELTDAIGLATANIATLEEKVANLTEEAEPGAMSLIATAAGMKKSISALKVATVAFLQPQPTFLQRQAPVMHDIAAMVQDQYWLYADLFEAKLDPAQRRTLREFVQVYTGKVPEKPQSALAPADVSRLLTTMRLEIEAELAAVTQSQARPGSARGEVRAAAGVTLAQLQDPANMTFEERTALHEQNSTLQMALLFEQHKLQNLQRTHEDGEAWTETFTTECDDAHSEFEERSGMRVEEMQSLSEGLRLLMNDEAHDTFTRAYRPSLLQGREKEFVEHRQERQRELRGLAEASAVLRGGEAGNVLAGGVSAHTFIPVLLQEAASSHFPEIPRAVKFLGNHTPSSLLDTILKSAVVDPVGPDNFTEVIASITDMMSTLEGEQRAEAVHRDSCLERKSQLTLIEEELTAQVTRTQEQRASKEAEIAEIADQIAAADKAISFAQQQQASDEADLNTEVANLRTLMEDQQHALGILANAKETLVAFYNEKGLAHPPVVEVITQVIGQTQALKAKAEADKEAAERDLAQTGVAAQDVIQGQGRIKSDLEAQVELLQGADAGVGLIDSITLPALQTQETDLGTQWDLYRRSCEFLLEHFEERQKGYAAERDSLRDAIHILQGADLD